MADENCETRPFLLVEQLADILIKDILDGTLEGGSKLSEPRLQKQFKVSRSPLREALRVMEKRGLVEIIPRRGAFVRKVSRKDVEDNFPIRAVLEGLAAKMACIRREQSMLDSLALALDGMKRAVADNNAQQYTAHHVKFHEAYIQGSGNEELIELTSRVRMHAIWHRYYFKFHQEDFSAFLTGHTFLMEMLTTPATDPSYVEHYIKKHIMIAQKRFLQYLDENAY